MFDGSDGSSIWIFDGSTLLSPALYTITICGKAMTSPTMTIWISTKGTAPQ